MHKFFVLSFFSLVFVFSQANAQRHITGSKHLEVQAGAIDQWRTHHYLSLHYYRQSKQNFFWRIGAEGSRTSLGVPSIIPAVTMVPVARYLLKANYYYTLFSMMNSSVYFNVGIGPLAGYEYINNDSDYINEAVRLRTKTPWVGGGARGPAGGGVFEQPLDFLAKL